MKPRHDHLDAVRGAALCGILLIHSVALGGMAGLFGLGVPDLRPSERATYIGLVWLVESKFFCLFSFLFGAGFALQWPREPRPGAGRRFARRLLALAGFGVAHVLFVWNGDILLSYAVVGGVLVLFRRCRPRTLVRWAVGLLTLPALIVGLLTGGTEAARQVAPDEVAKIDRDILAEFTKPQATPTSYAGVQQERLAEYPAVLVLLASRVPSVLALFLLGMAAERSGWVADPHGHRRRIRRVAWWAGGGGLVVAGLVTMLVFTRPAASALASLFFNQTVAGPVLALGYAATFTLVLARRAVPLLAAYGRMALTNYLSHSLILYLLFSPDAGGLRGKIPPEALLGVGVSINLLLMGTSTFWLRRFRYGPLEWLWRAITYWQIPQGERGA